MKKRFDVIVVGAGPAGSTAAYLLAREGLEVVLIERGEYPGAKNVSGAAFYGSRILDGIIPNFWSEAPVERYLTRRVVVLLSPEASLAIDFKTESFSQPPYNGFTLLRPKFDRWLADKARQAGALLVPSTVVDDLLWEGGKVVGVRARRDEGELYSHVVIAADGVNSLLAKKAGLQREFHPREVSLGVKEIISLDRRTIEERFNLSGDEGVTMELLGYSTRQVHGGGWLYTNRESLSVGIVVQLSSLVQQRVKPYDLLEDLKQHSSVAPLLKGGMVKEYSAHLIPEAGWGMIPRLYADGMLVAGDAAGLVLATGLFLEGMNYAIASGAAAAQAVKRAKEKGDFSAQTLSYYHHLLNESFVLKDLKSFRHAPDFINNPRFQNLYPGLACRVAERLFTVADRPKGKVLPVIMDEVRRHKVSLLRALSDGFQGGRALLW